MGSVTFARRFLLCVGAAVFVASVCAAAPAVAHPGGPRALFVAPSGRPWRADDSCRSASFNSVGAAVAAAPVGGSVIVCPGTYTEDVIVPKALTLIGINATMDATGLENAVQVVASNVSVERVHVRERQRRGTPGRVSIRSPTSDCCRPPARCSTT